MKFELTKTFKGYLYAAIASVALANSFIFSKLAFSEISFFQFGLYWFFLGTIWNLIYVVVYNKKKSIKIIELFKSINIPVIIIALLEALATGLFYYAILIMENPGVVSFIGNIGPVFVVLLGLFFLKESFNQRQLLGIILAIGGIFTLNLSNVSSVNDIFLSGSIYVIMASLLFAVATITARKHRKNIDAGVLSLIRAFILLFSFIFLSFLNNDFALMSLKTTIYVSLGSFLEVFITIVFAYKSLQYVQAFKTSIIISSKGVIALFSAWIFLLVEPKMSEIIGGVISIIGVILVSVQNEKK